MTKKKYAIHIGKECINGITQEEMKCLRKFMSDFLIQEQTATLTSLQESMPVLPTPQPPLIYEDLLFDSDTHTLQTEFCIFTENDSLTNLSRKEIKELYYTLQSFLNYTEKPPVNTPPHTPASDYKDAKEVHISPQHTDQFESLSEDRLSVCKRIWLNNKQGIPQEDYSLTTPHGSAFRISSATFLSLYKKLSDH